MVTLDQWRALRAVAETGSISGAAAAAHLAQPTLSHHIASLEKTLGAPVVLRSRRGSQLTALGAVALQHAEAILARSAAAEHELRAEARQGAMTVSLGSFPSAVAALVVPALVAVAADVRTALNVAEQPQLIDELTARTLHVAILASDAHSVPAPIAEVHLKPIFEDPLVVLMPDRHPAARRPEVAINDLTADPWIVAAAVDDPPRDALIRAFAGLGREPRIAFRVDDFAVTEALVAAGLGVALIPSIALAHLAGIATVRPLANTLVRRLYVAWQSHPASPGVERVVQAVRAVATPARQAARHPRTP